jgi:hypothetical protein
MAKLLTSVGIEAKIAAVAIGSVTNSSGQSEFAPS